MIGRAPGTSPPSYGRWAASLVAALLVAMCLTVVFWGMRAVMEVGGACGSGNSPYVIQTPCPGGTWTMAVAIPLGIVSAFAFAVLAPGGFGGLAGLAWTALFVSLGWNFLEYAFDPPGTASAPVWGWLICGVVFVAMGVGPLLVAIPAIRSARRRPAPRYLGAPPVPSPVRRVAASVTSRARTRTASPGGTAGAGTAPAATVDVGNGDLVERLERLAALRASGALDGDEFEAAKRRLLEGGEG